MTNQWFCYLHVGDETPLMLPLDALDRKAALKQAHDLLTERPHATHAELWDGDLTERIERAAGL